MNAIYLKQRYFLTFLSSKSTGFAATLHRDSLTPFQFFRNMATNTTSVGPGKMKNLKQKEKQVLRRQKTKNNLSKRGTSDGPSTVYLQVIGAGSRDNPASVYVFSEFNRYLFNCGEGTQRLMQEHKLRVSSLDNIFLTRVSWETVGGLSGMILTLRDIGVTKCALSGPPQLEKFVNAIKVFSGSLEDIALSVRPYTEQPYSDETMTIYQVPIFSQSEDRGRISTATPGSPSRSTEREGQGLGEFRGERRPTTRDTSLAVAFVCKVHPKKGNFLVSQAVDLGLPVGTAAIGPLIAELKAGRTITYNGVEIQPEQVCTPTYPGPIFIIVECPSEEFVSAVCLNEQLKRYQIHGEEDPAVLVVHMTPESVLNTGQYKAWMERFSSATHLILNEHACTDHNIRSYKIQAQLNMIHPEVFPPLRSYRTKAPQATLHVPIVRGECLLKFQLRPGMEWQRDAVPSCNTEEFVKEASEIPNFLEEVENCKSVCSTDAAEASGPKYPEVVFLGTGSALPMKIRNVSGTLVNISPDQSMLLDCGEGTFSQLCKHYGDSVDTALSKISTVFISHMHADHHTGLLNVLYQREKAMKILGLSLTPISLIAPRQIMSWLNQYHDHCEEIVGYVKFIPNMALCVGAETTKQWTKSLVTEMLKKNDLLTFQTCKVHHYQNAFACCITHQSGWKLAFSGDTMPCDAFVHLGKNATLLIHEATLEDGLEQDAAEKRHSTTSQAIGVGVKMNAEFIMLNHFSQRYAKIPLFSEDFTDKVGISFDHMRISFADFKIIPRLIPALKTLFAVDLEEMTERREKREMKTHKGNVSEMNGPHPNTACGSKRVQEEGGDVNVEEKRMKTL
ncbi:zinc phosphodiesterase ELAC protein 2 isoform X1 [Cynoglossus semilaevis]|nr:zinc phosphodiesterase ELAC protein 2 isoform X1 [Cynoglossus semilaevis]